jgi:YfiH family protein
MGSVLTSPLLDNLGWVRHGFGTRDTPQREAQSQDGMATLRQIHSSIVRIAPIGINPLAPACAGEGDALITNVAGTTVSIRTADCLPILLADAGCRAVAAVHAGWRGTAVGVVRETILRMRMEYDTDPSQIHAAIGPGIGVCCYQVGQEVLARFDPGFHSLGHLDLAGANRRQLMEAGVPESQIEMLPLCTFCDPIRFHSYRRDGERAGRMISFIGAL